MREKWLHVPRDWPEMPQLDPILKRDIDLSDIHAEYNDYCASPTSNQSPTISQPIKLAEPRH